MNFQLCSGDGMGSVVLAATVLAQVGVLGFQHFLYMFMCKVLNLTLQSPSR